MLAKRMGVNLARRAASAKASCLVVRRRRCIVDVIQAGGIAKTCVGGDRRIESRAASGPVARRWYVWASKVSALLDSLVWVFTVREGLLRC